MVLQARLGVQGQISRDETQRFVAYSLRKLRSEIKRQQDQP